MRISSSLLPVAMGVLVVALTVLVGCGEDESPAEELPTDAAPLVVDATARGLPVELNGSYRANRVKYQTHADDVGALFVYEQIFSEYVDAIQGATGRPALDERIDDLYEEFESTLSTIGTHYIVVDLQRLDREWLVDWEGLSRDEAENREVFHFGGPDDRRREDYWPDVQSRLEDTVFRAAPDAIIVGMEMNRYYDQNRDDWPNYVEFFWTMFDAIKAADSSVRVAAGVNWSYFVESQIRQFADDNESISQVGPFERAFSAIIEPLVTRLDGGGNAIGSTDFVALAAIPDPNLYDGRPSNLPDYHFAGLRHRFGRGTTPIVWFQLGWPIRSAGSSAPAEFYSRFLELAGGVTVERVSWYGLPHLLNGDCLPLTGDRVGASETICFRGIFTVSGADTALVDAYFGQ